jgi:hypothetical protein
MENEVYKAAKNAFGKICELQAGGHLPTIV